MSAINFIYVFIINILLLLFFVYYYFLQGPVLQNIMLLAVSFYFCSTNCIICAHIAGTQHPRRTTVTLNFARLNFVTLSRPIFHVVIEY